MCTEVKIYYGRGGWTWYTGSSSWYYNCGIENILGFKIINNKIFINPCIPKEWNEYSIQYKFKESIYNIKVKNNKENQGQIILQNGSKIETAGIVLENNKKINNIEIIL